MTVKWQFTDPSGLVPNYQWEVNPNDKTPGLLPKFVKNLIYSIQLGPNQMPLILETRDNLPETQATGTSVTQDQYLQMVTWFNLNRPIIVTDDLGNQWTVYFTNFQPVRKRSINLPWAAEYTLNWLVLNVVYAANPGRGK